MNRIDSIARVRGKLRGNGVSVGSWMQIPHSSVAEIMGQSGYDWIAVDMEHGSVGHHQLPDLFRAIELGNCLPLARLAEGTPKECKQALDAGSGGVIVPMVESSEQLSAIRNACRWPPSGNRGVGFSRGNLFGKNFDSYSIEAQNPLLIAMIESHTAYKNLDNILSIDGLDAILIGPYDLSASMNLTGQFDQPEFLDTISAILNKCQKMRVAAGLHIINPSREELNQRISEGFRFIAYSIDAIMLRSASEGSNFKD